jgi:topoisomerase-4 subunit B
MFDSVILLYTTMVKKTYTASDIEILKGIEPVQKRPGMYTDTSTPNHLLQEVLDNCVDESIAGFCNNIDITLNTDGSYTVKDDGRGMPVDIHPEYKKSGVEVIMTNLHSGAKFSNKNYKYSGGLHGVGVSVVSALSESLIVDIERTGDQNLHQISFKNGIISKKLCTIAKTTKNSHGTCITFKPNKKYFDSEDIQITRLHKLVEAKTILKPGLKIIINDLKYKTGNKVYCHTGSLDLYLKNNLKSQTLLPIDPILIELDDDLFEVSSTVCWIEDIEEIIQDSYVNLIPTSDGGTHVNSLKSAVADSLRDFMITHKIMPKNLKIIPDDIWKNTSYLISIKISDPQFVGQTKNKLQSTSIGSKLSSQLKDRLELWLNNHSDTAEEISNLAIQNAYQRLSNNKTKKIQSSTKSIIMPSRLSDCSSKDNNVNELFLVEGDSAGGSAKQARDRTFQAILPLRGKILNTWEVSSSKILESKEVQDISIAIGVKPGESNLSSLRYGKICILADADSDGLHIATLLIALFVKHFPDLILNEHIYVALPPLYRLDYKNKTYYAISDDHLNKILSQHKIKSTDSNLSITRFKGLGEMNPSQLRDTTLTPASRKLILLSLDHKSKDIKKLNMMLSKKTAPDRKVWLEKKGNLAQTS